MSELAFVADESVDFRIIDFLRSKGLSVISILEDMPSINDKEVLEFSNNQKAILITEDKDFGELSFRLKLAHHGVLLLRLAGLELNAKCNLTYQAISQKGEELLFNFASLDGNKLRITKI